MDFQLFGRFDQLNALAGLPNEPRNVPCATGHLPGPLGPATDQQRPKCLNQRIFGLSELRGHFNSTPKSKRPLYMDQNKPAACLGHVGVWRCGTYSHHSLQGDILIFMGAFFGGAHRNFRLF